MSFLAADFVQQKQCLNFSFFSVLHTQNGLQAFGTLLITNINN